MLKLSMESSLFKRNVSGLGEARLQGLALLVAWLPASSEARTVLRSSMGAVAVLAGPGRRGSVVNALPVFAVVAVGVVLLLVGTRAGLAIKPDTAAYVGGAHSLAEGTGYSILGASGERNPVVNWPPLYPLVLAGLELGGLHAMDAARFLNAFLFIATAFLFAWLLLRTSSGSWVVASLGTAAFVLGPTLVPRYQFALSEPLFLFLVVVTFVALDQFLQGGSRVALLGAAVATGMSCVTRESGIALLATGVAMLFLLGPRSSRLRDAAIFGAIALVPWIAWHAYVLSQPRYYANSLSEHFDFQRLQNGYGVIAQWLFPEPIPSWVRLPLFGLVLLAIGFAAARTLHRGGASGFLDALRALHPAAQIALAFIVIYGALLCLTMWFLGSSAATRADARQLSPIFVASIVVASSALRVWIRSERVGRAIALCACAILVLYAIDTTSDAFGGPIRADYLPYSVLARQGL